MLALTRKSQESIIIDGNIEIKILEIQGDKVRIGIEAPEQVSIYREEIYSQIKKANEEANNTSLAQLAQLRSMIKK